ncbi:MAG TPA: ABC transporter permease [Gemmatimonadales bacterium]|nr:ABC transporter permease [Gemmatimonadales bacterium]
MQIGRLFEGVGIALDSLRANKVRAALTILGVAIGVMVVIAMASMVTGINRGVEKELENLGPKTFIVSRFFQGGLNISDGSDELSPWRRNPWLNVEEAKLIRKLPAIREVAWREGTGGPVSFGDRKLSSVNITGFSASWTAVQGGAMAQGRNFTDLEEAAGSAVVVLNEKLAQELFDQLDPIGKRVKIFGVPFDVVGVYTEPSSVFGGEPSPQAYIPHSTFTKVADYWRGWMDFAVMPTAEASVFEAQDQVIAALRAARGLKPSQENNFAVITQDKILESFGNMTAGFFLVMLVLSSVGLMVGGVGVVAIMMISVTERTREIGVRKALGATRREIMFQFLVEAATLTLVGGLAGMLLGGLISVAVNKFTPIPALVPLWSVVVAVFASTITGICFGLYPASKASKLDPVEALRYE